MGEYAEKQWGAEGGSAVGESPALQRAGQAGDLLVADHVHD
jgi:hypothetical protein